MERATTSSVRPPAPDFRRPLAKARSRSLEMEPQQIQRNFARPAAVEGRIPQERVIDHPRHARADQRDFGRGGSLCRIVRIEVRKTADEDGIVGPESLSAG